VAQLAGVSVDWYTWLEQKRPITVSTQVLESLVQALHLNVSERKHLFFLAHQQPPPEQIVEPESVSPTLQRFLDRQGLSPAIVVGQRWDTIGWNEAACAVFGDYNQLTGRDRNAIWRLFTVPIYQEGLVNWEGHARSLLAQFRASCGRYIGDPYLAELIDDLMSCSPEFRAWWPDHEVLGEIEGRKLLKHPQEGYLLFEHLSFQVLDAPNLKVNIYTPLDETDTSAKISRLLSQKANLSKIQAGIN
jgi:hypothetical protein